ncbi:Fic/DOC family protein [Dyella jiangningensis]|uniref:Fic family protein n=1 Tax=Dyella sp. AtDHG13 TaxID=1938897 RepID=UPI00088CC602|nr:Fic family protein [Dyella sp. AtDHG13]PXV56886.1 Fic/DOC family protein [Dyella sp. AtDHG13]SDK59735.1 Fic/DOC family protein [Dyella jiangningensis]
MAIRNEAHFHVKATDRLPQPSAIERSLLDRVSDLSGRLGDIGPVNIQPWRQLVTVDEADIGVDVANCIRTIRNDELLDAYAEYHGDWSAIAFSTSDELGRGSELAGLRQALQGDLGNLDRFVDYLEELSTRVLNGPSSMRNHPIYTAADRHGRFVEYPAASSIRDQLGLLLDVLANPATDALFRATVAYVTIVNVHPFSDGNGRVARHLFNAVLRDDGLKLGAYVPIKELIAISRSGLIIHTARAWKRWEWNWIFADMCAAIELSLLLAQPSESWEFEKHKAGRT